MGHVFPEDEVSKKRLLALLDELSDAKIAPLYEVGGDRFIWIPKFWEHQVINRPRESEHPPHPDDPHGDLPIADAIRVFRGSFTTVAVQDHDKISADSRQTQTSPRAGACAGAGSAPLPICMATEERTTQTTKSSSTQTARIQQVFEAWIESTGRTSKTVLDAKRRRVIERALTAFTVDELIAAVRGWKRSPHHRGENATGTVYNDLTLLLRDADHIERFRDLEVAAGVRDTGFLARLAGATT
jgi:hypothetical protein